MKRTTFFADRQSLLAVVNRIRAEWLDLQVAVSLVLKQRIDQCWLILRTMINILSKPIDLNSYHNDGEKESVFKVIHAIFFLNSIVNCFDFDRLVLPHPELPLRWINKLLELHSRIRRLDINGPVNIHQWPQYLDCLQNNNLNLWLKELYLHNIELNETLLKGVSSLAIERLSVSCERNVTYSLFELEQHLVPRSPLKLLSISSNPSDFLSPEYSGKDGIAYQVHILLVRLRNVEVWSSCFCSTR